MSKAYELYVFSLGPLRFNYTSADHDIVINSVTFLSTFALSRTSLGQSTEVLKSNLQISMGGDCDVALLFRVQPPSTMVTVKLYQLVDDDPSVLPGIVWMGRITQAEWANNTCTLTADPSYSALQRMGLRRCWQLSCPHALYGNECGALPANFQTNGVVAGVVNGVNLAIGAAGNQINGYFNGGYVEYENESAVVDRRMIVGHTGGVITIDRQFAAFPANAVVAVFPGCGHHMTDCGNKFKNLLNYGGTPYIPNLNPFGSDPVY